jgi:uncharacterized protein (DUF1499 family)
MPSRLARLALALLALGLAACIGEKAPGSVVPDAIPDPTTLARTGRPNDWLICPAAGCRAKPAAIARHYPVPPAELWEAWRAVVTQAPRATLIAEDQDRRLFLAQDRTPVLRFIDTIAVRVLPAGENGSSFAAYSRSELGYFDFGANRRRLERWVARVEARLKAGD